MRFRNLAALSFFCLISTTTFADHTIVIQEDYWTGTKCLENGVPWQVPQSIYKESENCSKRDVALELGTGGSTIFLAQRCEYVIAIETDEAWAASVQKQLDQLNITNVSLHYIPQQAHIESFIKELDTSDVTIFSVDTVHGYNRSAFTNVFLAKGISPNLRMIVADNYGDSILFPYHYNTVIMDNSDWELFTYDDPHWCGNGTRLYIRK